ncbi:hypothetical protein B7H16_00375 [Anoxybacillus ayderensis]|nr:hypothetical protein B7H16_00375 [Anoxybacillus ayderensis]
MNAKWIKITASIAIVISFFYFSPSNSSWRSNIIISPYKDYRSDTISTINTAYVKLKGDPRTFYISAGV